MNFNHLMGKVRDAAMSGINAMSTGEALAVALVLNRHDWLAQCGYTMAQALDRLDPDTIPLIPWAAKVWEQEVGQVQLEQQTRSEDKAVAAIVGQHSDEPVTFTATLVTHSEAPGYRDVGLVFDVRAVGRDQPERWQRVELRIRPEDGEPIVSHIRRVHAFAWAPPRARPLDSRPGESRPAWIDR